MPFLFLSLTFSLNAQLLPYTENIPDGDEIPYGFTDLDLGLFYSHYVSYAIGAVETSTPDGYVFVPQISKNQGSPLKGLGLNLNVSLLHLFLYKDQSRLKIADDFGLGVYGLLGFGIQGHAGVRGIFRVNDLIDVGAQYYPFYTQADWKDRSGVDIGNSDFKRGYGFHLRIASVYVDANSIKINEVNGNNVPNHSRYNFVKIKVLYTEDSDSGFNNFNLTIGSARISNQLAVPAYDAVHQEFSDSKNKYLFVSLGWGITF